MNESMDAYLENGHWKGCSMSSCFAIVVFDNEGGGQWVRGYEAVDTPQRYALNGVGNCPSTWLRMQVAMHGVA